MQLELQQQRTSKQEELCCRIDSFTGFSIATLFYLHCTFGLGLEDSEEALQGVQDFTTTIDHQVTVNQQSMQDYDGGVRS